MLASDKAAQLDFLLDIIIDIEDIQKALGNLCRFVVARIDGLQVLGHGGGELNENKLHTSQPQVADYYHFWC
jgi:hypothetical protein